jgi:hypothetical protein
MTRPFQAGSTLSVHRAFVVHLRPWGGARRRRFRGRVEHLSSGRAAQFSSLRELLQFVSAALDVPAPPAFAGSDDPWPAGTRPSVRRSRASR